MMRFEPSSFRVKLWLVLTAASLVTLLLAGVGLVVLEAHSHRDTVRTELQALAEVLASNCAAALAFGDADAAEVSIAALHVREYVLEGRVLRGDGELFAHYVSDPSSADRDPSGRVLEVEAPVLLDGERLGEVVIVFDLERSLAHRLSGKLQMLAIVLAIAVLIAIALGSRLQAIVARPIGVLAAAARRVTRTREYTASVELDTRDEIGELAGAFNEMLGEIHRREVELRAARDELEERVRARTAELVEARDAALASSRLKSEFLANMSHEIRTPIHGVIGMTELALDRGLSDAEREYVEAARGSARSLLDIIDDVLDFSRIEAGRLELRCESFSPESLVASAVETLRVRASEKGLGFELESDAGLPNALCGDPVRIRQVLVNLVGNAVKFTDAGRVRVQIGAQSRRSDPRTLDLELIVSDTGVGIPAEMRAQVFEAFRQVDGSMSRRHGGTGLGLAITRQLVEIMGGTITVESEQGRGSTFRVVMPLKVPLAPLREAEDGPVTSDGVSTSLRILVAEDHPVNKLLAERLLQSWGHEVILAEDGLRAIELWKQRQPDVILMDIQMPRVDGLEATRRIREFEADGRRRTPIIALTAHAMPAHREECLAAGADDYVTKPLDRKLLEASLERVVRGEFLAQRQETG